jgi:hypothetical protein
MMLFAGLRGIWNAQSNALVCGLLLLGCAEAVGSRWWRSALWLSLAVLIKLTPLAVVLLLLVVEPRRLGPRVLVLLTLGLLLPFLTRSPAVVIEQHNGWLQQMRQSANERWPGFRDAWMVWNLATNPPEGDLKGYLKTPLQPEQAFAYRVIQLVTALGAFLWVVWLHRRGTPRWLHLTLALGGGTGWLLLVGPSVEHPTFVLLAPTLIWGLLQSRHWLIGLASFLILVLGWGALTDPFVALTPWVLIPLPLGTSLYLVWLLWSGPNQSGILPPSRDPATLESTPCDAQPG